jgi:hypothetical protein
VVPAQKAARAGIYDQDRNKSGCPRNTGPVEMMNLGHIEAGDRSAYRKESWRECNKLDARDS